MNAVVDSVIPPEYLASLHYYASRAPEGAIVEIGVYRGGSASVLALLGRELYLYDTFGGMPVSGEKDKHQIGDFSDTSIELVQSRVPGATLVPGVFPDSLIEMPPVAFVHADADQYESTKAICDLMPKLMVPGGMLLFDDFMVKGCEGCTEAVLESFRRVLVTEAGKALVIL